MERKRSQSQQLCNQCCPEILGQILLAARRSFWRCSAFEIAEVFRCQHKNLFLSNFLRRGIFQIECHDEKRTALEEFEI